MANTRNSTKTVSATKGTFRVTAVQSGTRAIGISTPTAIRTTLTYNQTGGSPSTTQCDSELGRSSVSTIVAENTTQTNKVNDSDWTCIYRQFTSTNGRLTTRSRKTTTTTRTPIATRTGSLTRRSRQGKGTLTKRTREYKTTARTLKNGGDSWSVKESYEGLGDGPVTGTASRTATAVRRDATFS